MYGPYALLGFYLLTACITEGEEEPLIEDLMEEQVDVTRNLLIGKAEYKPHHQKTQEEDKMYYVPSMQTGTRHT